MPKTKPVKRPSARKAKREIVYTYRDAAGIRWRKVGARAVSELADKTMRECGLEPL